MLNNDGLSSNYNNPKINPPLTGNETDKISDSKNSLKDKIDKTLDQVFQHTSFGFTESKNSLLGKEKNETDWESIVNKDENQINDSEILEVNDDIEEDFSDSDSEDDLGDALARDGEIESHSENLNDVEEKLNTAEEKLLDKEFVINYEEVDVNEVKVEVSEEKTGITDGSAKVSITENKTGEITQKTTEKIDIQKDLHGGLKGLKEECQGVYSGKTSLIEVILSDFEKLSKNESLSPDNIVKLIKTHIEDLAKDGKLTKRGPMGELIPLTDVEVANLIKGVDKHLKKYVAARVEIQKTQKNEDPVEEKEEKPKELNNNIDSKPSIYVCTRNDRDILRSLSSNLDKMLGASKEIGSRELVQILKMIAEFRITEAVKEKARMLRDKKKSEEDHKILNRDIDKREIQEKQIKETELKLSQLKKNIEGNRLKFGEVEYTQLIASLDASLDGIRKIVIRQNSVVKEA